MRIGELNLLFNALSCDSWREKCVHVGVGTVGSII